MLCLLVHDCVTTLLRADCGSVLQPPYSSLPAQVFTCTMPPLCGLHSSHADHLPVLSPALSAAAAVTSRLPSAVTGQAAASPPAGATAAPQLGPASGHPLTSSLSLVSSGSSSTSGQVAESNQPSAASALAAGLAAAAGPVGAQPPWTSPAAGVAAAGGGHTPLAARAPANSAFPSSAASSSNSSSGEVWQALYQQQVQVARLQKQNRELRAALCRARPRDPVCRAGQGSDATGGSLWSE